MATPIYSVVTPLSPEGIASYREVVGILEKSASIHDFVPRDPNSAGISILNARDFTAMHEHLPDDALFKSEEFNAAWPSVFSKMLRECGPQPDVHTVAVHSVGVFGAQNTRPILSVEIRDPWLESAHAALRGMVLKLSGVSLRESKLHLSLGKLGNDPSYQSQIMTKAAAILPETFTVDRYVPKQNTNPTSFMPSRLAQQRVGISKYGR